MSNSLEVNSSFSFASSHRRPTFSSCLNINENLYSARPLVAVAHAKKVHRFSSCLQVPPFQIQRLAIFAMHSSTVSSQTSSEPKPQVVIIGAGPVGLWTAVQTKLRNPDVEIDVLEKHSTYQRAHVVSVAAESFRGHAIDPRLEAIVKEFTSQKNIRTNDIETKLTALAEELGIRILKNVHVSDPRTLQNTYPNLKVVIGADGSHSTVRQTIFNNALSHEGDLKFILDVKYEVVGQAKPLDFIRSVYPTLKTIDTIAQEYVGTEKEGKTPVTLRLFIDRKTYEQMKDATFKHPFTLENEEQIKEEMMKKIQLWLQLKKQKGEVRVEGSERITATRLGYYASKEVVKEENGITTCLVGDSTFGVPFFRSLNNGLQEGTYLSKKVVSALFNHPSLLDRMLSSFKRGVKSPFASYALYVKTLAQREILWARVKSFALDCLLYFVKISARVPWQTNYWTEAQVQQLLQA